MLAPAYRKYFWLLGAILFLVCGIGGILALNSNEATQPPVASTSPASSPAAAPPRTAPPPPKAEPAQPELKPQPQVNPPTGSDAPKEQPPAPPVEAIPTAGVKQLDENKWRVVFSVRDGWFDTGIPVLANTHVSADNERSVWESSARWMMKIGGKVFFESQVGNPILIGEGTNYDQDNDMTVGYDFKDTIKIKVDDEGRETVVWLIIYTENYFDFYAWSYGAPIREHQALHQPFFQWAAMMKERIARR